MAWADVEADGTIWEEFCIVTAGALTTSSPSRTWDVGDTVTFAASLTDTAGTAVDSSMTCQVTSPSGVATSLGVVRTSLGHYSAGLVVDEFGEWGVGWLASGAYSAAQSDGFTVRDPSIVPVLSLSDAKAYLGITQSTWDEQLRGMIDAACSAGERYTGRVFGRRDVTVTQNVDGRPVVLSTCPIIAMDSVTVDGVAVDYDVDMAAGIVAIDAVGESVTVTATVGYLAQPATDVQGVREMVRHLWQTQRGTIRAMAGSDDWSPQMSFSIPRRVQELWDLNRIPGWV